ncbi:MAG: Na/Pi symporter [Halothece sp.]
MKVFNIILWLFVIVLLYFLLVAVRLMSVGFQLALGEEAETLFTFATNPFLGLIIGILATAMIQSSSTVISIVIGLVAGGLPVGTAIPIVMGSNLGTTLTNTVVSLGHVKASEEFKRAFAAATVHDCFNLFCLLLLFPLELVFHPLEKLATYLTQFLLNSEQSWNILDFSILDYIINPIITQLAIFTNDMSSTSRGITFVIIGISLIFGSIFYLSKTLKSLLVGKAKEILHNAIGRGGAASILVGMGITGIIQSSSATTSLMIPLAGNGVFTLEQIYPFTLGANIGTCFTALIVATALTGKEAFPGLEIALVHLLYNSLGVLIIYFVPFLRNLPLQAARFLAEVAVQYKWAALGYIILFFLLFPALGLGITNQLFLNVIPFLENCIRFA